MELLIAVIVATFVSGLRQRGRTIPMRTVLFIAVCTVVAGAYYGQRVI